jgi:hypothetical protein
VRHGRTINSFLPTAALFVVPAKNQRKMADSSKKLQVSTVFYGYAGFLFSGGLGAFVMSGMQAKAKTSVCVEL